MRGPRAGRVCDLCEKGYRVNVSGRIGQVFGSGRTKFATCARILRRIKSRLNFSPMAYQQLTNGRVALGDPVAHYGALWRPMAPYAA